MTFHQITRTPSRRRMEQIADEVLEAAIEFRIYPRKVDEIGRGNDGGKLPTKR